MTSSTALLWAVLVLRTLWLLPDWVGKWQRVARRPEREGANPRRAAD